MITTKAHLVKKEDSPSGEVSFIYLQPEQIFSFLEGQFVMLEAKIGDKLIKKPYSIATTSKQLQEEKHIGIIVKKTSEQGMSNFLTQVITENDEITIKGPVGHYTNSFRHNNYLLVSTGSGLSPNVAHFMHLVYEEEKYSHIINVFGERFYTNIIPEVEALFTQHGRKNIENLFCLSKEEKIPAGYTAGYVQDALEECIKKIGTDTTVFVCGKPDMVKDVIDVCTRLGIEKEDIVFEKY